MSTRRRRGETGPDLWRVLVALVAVAVAIAACGDSDSEVSRPEGTASSASETAANELETTEVTAAPVAEADELVEDGASGSQDVLLEFPDGRSWQLTGECFHEPSRTEAAQDFLSIRAENDQGAILDVLGFRALDGSDDDGLSASLQDETGSFFSIIEVVPDGEGTDITVELGFHDGMKTVDDPVDFVATATCSG